MLAFQVASGRPGRQPEEPADLDAGCRAAVDGEADPMVVAPAGEVQEGHGLDDVPRPDQPADARSCGIAMAHLVLGDAVGSGRLPDEVRHPIGCGRARMQNADVHDEALHGQVLGEVRARR